MKKPLFIKIFIVEKQDEELSELLGKEHEEELFEVDACIDFNKVIRFYDDELEDFTKCTAIIMKNKSRMSCTLVFKDFVNLLNSKNLIPNA